MKLDKIIKPLHFNENGVALGSNKYFLEKRVEHFVEKCIEAKKNYNEYWIAYCQSLNFFELRDHKAIGLFGNKYEAEKACNEHNQLHIFKNLLTEDGQKAITEFELL